MQRRRRGNEVAGCSRHSSLSRRTPAGGSFRRAWVFFSAFLFLRISRCTAQKVDIDKRPPGARMGHLHINCGRNRPGGRMASLEQSQRSSELRRTLSRHWLQSWAGRNDSHGNAVLYFIRRTTLRLTSAVSLFSRIDHRWYPRATRIEPSSSLENVALFQRQSSGSILWNSVRVQPSANLAFPQEAQSSHYYAARDVASSPLQVSQKTATKRKFLSTARFRRACATLDPGFARWPD